jgi:formylglycine-generating enzyme required for sulfatase activity
MPTSFRQFVKAERVPRSAAAALMAVALASPARADVDPLTGIDFVTINAPGNAPWPGDGRSSDQAIGRGAVNYTYALGRFEVTTAQWAEFFNAAFDRPDPLPIPSLRAPTLWGGTSTTPINPGRSRWTVRPGNEMVPVGGITWRTAAIYCNWLTNGKATNQAAFMNGAYDASTLFNVGNGFRDQPTHNPGAKYWIPT